MDVMYWILGNFDFNFKWTFNFFIHSCCALPMWVNKSNCDEVTRSVFWKCSIKVLLKCGSFSIICVMFMVWLTPLMSHPLLFFSSHTHTLPRMHTKVSTPLLWFSHSLSLSHTHSLPVWVEFNRVLWCERDVSLKNIRHQRSLLRWSGISSCAHSAQSGSCFFLSRFWYHKAIPKCQTAKENGNLNLVTVIILKFLTTDGWNVN